MLLIKLLCLLLCQSCHFDITNCKSVLLDQVNYLSCIHITIRFDHGESLPLLSLELGLGKLISILYDLKLPGVNIQNRTNKNILKLNPWVLCLFQKCFPILNIKHFYGFVFKIVCKVICPDNWCCTIIPLYDEDVSILIGWHVVIRKRWEILTK